MYAVIGFITFLLLHVEGIYFHIKESEERCFIEDVPSDTKIQGTYKFLMPQSGRYVSSPKLRAHFKVYDPDEKIMLSREYESEGTFVFNADKAGEHRICLWTNSESWFGGKQLRVHFDISIGDHAVNYQEVAAKEKLTELQLRVRQLIDQVESIAKDQDYQRIREEQFRRLSESTATRVNRWSIGQAVVLACISFWQMRHLRSFFKAKKLV